MQRRTRRVPAHPRPVYGGQTLLLATCVALVSGLVQIVADGQLAQSIEELLARFSAPAPPPYRAFRRLEGGLTGSSGKQAWLEAWTELAPRTGFTYQVVSEGGHAYVRNKILRNVLRSEQDLLARGKPLRAPLVAHNYAFEDGGMTDGGLQRVVLKPTRKSDGIVKGSLLLNRDSGSLVQIEGRLLKSPSFWIRDVDVTWNYASIGGHDLPVEMISSARVRLFGRSTFTMTYRYVSLDGRPISGATPTPVRDQSP